MSVVCYSLLFTDRVITENNGKKGLIGVFSQFNFLNFPAIAPPWYIYVAITNISGRHEFSLNLVRDEAQNVVLPIAGEIEIPDAESDTELIIPIVNLTFQKEGIHTLTFNIDGKQIGSRVLKVKRIPPSGGD